MIATSAKVDLKGIDEKTVEKVGEEGYFTREKKGETSGEEAFFKQGEKPEVSLRIYHGNLSDHVNILWALQKKKVASVRASDQKAVDKALLPNIKSEPFLLDYLRSTFSLRNGDKPHEMKW